MIYRNLIVYLQRVLHTAAHKYFFYICGTIDENKFEQLQERFALYYFISESKWARYRRRKRGEAVAMLHAVKHNGRIHFCLMATTGRGRIHEREKLSDLRNKPSRLHSPDGKYQVVQDGNSWSWSMNSAYYKKYRERIHICSTLPPHRRFFCEAGGINRDILTCSLPAIPFKSRTEVRQILENDGHEEEQIHRRTNHWVPQAGRSRHVGQGAMPQRGV